MITFDSRYYPKAARRFVADASDHEMTVMHDDGLYRHLRFQKPGTGIYHFDLITWPGYLAITGDVAAFTFVREQDMFPWFASGGDINPGYWSEKITAQDKHGGAQEFSPAKFRRHVADAVREHIAEAGLDREQARALWQAINADVLDESEYEQSARPALNDFTHRNYSTEHKDAVFDGGDLDAWDWDTRDFTWSFLWSCCAIRWGIQQYRAAALAVPAGLAA